jgi:uncharacterized protein DUF3224
VERGYEAVFSRVWVAQTERPPATGLWWCRADAASSERSDWSEPVQIMSAADSPWDSGPWKPAWRYAENDRKRSANARFAITNWDEKPYSEGQDLPRLTRASVTKTFTGDVEGVGHVEYLMMYRSDGSATFVGLERFVGRIEGTSGSFVHQRIGVFEGGQAKESYSVIPGSATGDLRALRGAAAPPLATALSIPSHWTLNCSSQFAVARCLTAHER